jgi:hypothetical protein
MQLTVEIYFQFDVRWEESIVAITSLIVSRGKDSTASGGGQQGLKLHKITRDDILVIGS